MVRILGFAALIVQGLGARVEVHDAALASTTTTRGLELLEQLKTAPTDVNLQNEYSELIGDVEFLESRVFLETGVQIQQEPVSLGAQSSSGQVMMMAERTGILESLGRFLTNRRSYVFKKGLVIRSTSWMDAQCLCTRECSSQLWATPVLASSCAAPSTT